MQRHFQYFFLFLYLISNTLIAQNQVQIQILQPIQNQNFEGTLSNLKELSDRLQAQVRQVNNAGRRRVNLLATLENTSRSVIIRTRTNAPIELNGMVPFQLLGRDLPEFFDASMLETEGIDRNELLAGGFLPEGFYKLCVVAFDAGVQDGFSAQLTAPNVGCVSLRAQYPEPPRLQSLAAMPVVAGMVVPLEKKLFNILWIPTVAIGTTVRYTLRISDMGDFDINPEVANLDPNVAFQQNRQPTYEQLTDVTNVMVGQGGQMVVELEENHRYAVQVQATTQNGSAVKNNGLSQVVDFWFGSKPDANRSARRAIIDMALSAYPKSDDQPFFMPFRGMPVVIKYTPYSDDYKRFDSELEIFGLQTKKRYLGWSPNPLTAQRREVPGLSQEDAQYVAISHNRTETTGYNKYLNLDRGEPYKWSANVWISNKSERDESKKKQIDGSFTAGMGKPQLKLPANKDTLKGGDIGFKFQTALVPTLGEGFSFEKCFDIVQAQKGNIAGFDVSIKENAILEVSKSETFTSILFTDNFKIDKAFGQGEKGADIINFVYNEKNKTFKITDKGTYYWRVRWLKNPDGPITGAEYNEIEVWQFTIGDTTKKTKTPPPTGTIADRCKGNCVLPLPSGPAAGLSVGDVVKIGHFFLEPTTLTGSGTFSGEGVITNWSVWGYAPKLKVTFTNLKVTEINDTLQATAGQAVTVNGGHELLNLTEIALGQPLSLPLGINDSFGGHRITAQFNEVKFMPTTAEAAVKGAYRRPSSLQEYGLIADKICMVPGGFGSQVRLVLSSTITDPPTGNDPYQFYVKGQDGGDAERAFFMEFDCDSIRLQLAGGVLFARSTLVPENEAGKILPGKVDASYLLRITHSAHREAGSADISNDGMIAGLTFKQAFQVTGHAGWGYKVQDAFIDFSEMNNPPDMKFPDPYVFTWLTAAQQTDPRFVNNWMGFYCKNVQLRISNDLMAAGKPRKMVQVSDILVDKTGFTASLKVQNLLNSTESGWDFTIDQLAFSIVQTNTFSGSMDGKIRLPVFDAGSNLNYKMLLSSEPIGDSTGAKYICRVFVPADTDLKMTILAAKVKLDTTSFIEMNMGRTDKGLQLKAKLNGILSIDPSNGVVASAGKLMDLTLNDMRFENFGFNTDSSGFFTFKDVKKEIQEGKTVFAFASPQHSAGGFPITIKDISVVNQSEGGVIKPGLRLEADVTLSDLGFKGSLDMTLLGKLKLSGVKVIDYGFDKVIFNGIGIDCEFSGFGLSGLIKYYDNDATYGKGYLGSVAVKMPMKLAGALTLRFGSKGTPQVPASYYNYWYIDGMIHLKSGIQIGALSINAFGGGAYYHMKIANPAAMTSEAASLAAQKALKEPDKMPGSTIPSSGLQFVPDKNTYLGIRAGIVGSLLNAETAFNMDAALTAEFNASGGLNTVVFNGNGYLMQNLDKRQNPPMRASVNISYDHQNTVLDGDLTVMVNFYDVLYGRLPNKIAGTAKLHIDSEKWYFYLGSPSVRAGLKLEKGPLKSEMMTYVMVGHGIPTDLPPLPPFIMNLMQNGSGKKLDNGVTSVNRVPRNPQLYETGKGIAFGSSLDITNRLEFLVFYAQIRLMVGFDINVSQDPDRVCQDGSTPGTASGWFGQGQAYAGIEGSMGIHVDLLFIEGDFEIAKVGAAIQLVAKLPNPEYFAGRAALSYSILRGRVKGYCNFNIELGKNCIIANSNPLSDIKLISDMQPEGGTQSPLLDIKTAFFFPMNQPFELEEVKPDNTIIIRTFQPFIQRYELKKKNGPLVPNPTQRLERENVIAVLSPRDALTPQTDYVAEIEVRINEMTSGAPVLRPFKEIKSVAFKTDELPQVLVDVVESWPIQRQQFFLQDEGLEPRAPALDDVFISPVGKKGYVKVNKQGYLFKSRTASYNAVFTPTSPAGAAIKTKLAYDENVQAVDFDIPQLNNSTLYRLDLERIMAFNPADALGVSTATLSVKQTEQTRTFATSAVGGAAVQMVGGASTATITQSKIDGNTAPKYPPILYSYSFKTSKFNNHREKFAGALLAASNGSFLLARSWELQTNEPFETLDFPSTISDSRQRNGALTPLIMAYTPEYYDVLPSSHQKFRLFKQITDGYKALQTQGAALRNIDEPIVPIHSPYYANSGLQAPLPVFTLSSNRMMASTVNLGMAMMATTSTAPLPPAPILGLRKTNFVDLIDQGLYFQHVAMWAELDNLKERIKSPLSPYQNWRPVVNMLLQIEDLKLYTPGRQRMRFTYMVPTKYGSYNTVPIEFQGNIIK